jgi:hypothetical protein
MKISKEKFKMNILINIGAFGILTILWLGFAAALVFNQAMLDTIWQTLRGLPVVVQALVWLVILPVTAGLWIWEKTSWPLWIRLILVAGLAVATIYTFYPKHS